MKKTVILLVCATLIGGCTPKSEAERFADSLLKKMTLREKLGQMSQFAPNTGVVTGPDGDPIDVYAMIKAGEIGSILNLKTPQEIDRMCRNILIAKYELGLFDDPFRYGGADRFANSIYKEENMELAREVANRFFRDM